MRLLERGFNVTSALAEDVPRRSSAGSPRGWSFNVTSALAEDVPLSF